MNREGVKRSGKTIRIRRGEASRRNYRRQPAVLVVGQPVGAFHSDGKLWSVDAEQGGARRLIAAEPSKYGATWGPGGVIIFSRGVGETRLVKIPAAGGNAEPLTTESGSPTQINSPVGMPARYEAVMSFH